MIAEVPLALYILIFFITIPMLNLSTVALRASFLYMAAHVATVEAARAKTFEVNAVDQLSAKNLAHNQAMTTSALFNGITLDSVTTSILITNVNTLVQTRTASKLAAPADVANNTYQIEVRVNGTVQPIIKFNSIHFLNVPGLTAPLSLTFADRQMCENTQGLSR